MMVQCTCCVRVTWLDINLEHEDPTLFIIPQFGPRILVFIWYGFWWIYFTTTVFVDIFFHHTENRHLWLADFSNWCYLLIVCTLTVELTVRTFALFCNKAITTGPMEKLPWYMKLQWVLQNTCHSTVILTCALFYTLCTTEFTFSNANKHIITSSYVIINSLFLTSSPVKLLHAYQPIVFTSLYIVFTTIFQNVYKTDSYRKLYDWEDTLATLILTLTSVLLIVPIIHGAMFGIYKLRIYLHKKCHVREHSESLNCKHSSEQTIQRDITATDVILEETTRNYQYIDIHPEVKDDIDLKTSDESQRSLQCRVESRQYKSETDLRNYRMKNGFYCDFAKPSTISHFVSPRCGDKQVPDCNHNHDRRGSLIIVKKCNTPTSSLKGDNSLDSISDVSSDYLSQYLEEDLISYYL